MREARSSRDDPDGQLMAWKGAVSDSPVEALAQDTCRGVKLSSTWGKRSFGNEMI